MDAIKSADEFYRFISQKKPSIVVFSTHDCSTCPTIERKIEENFPQMKKRVVFLDDLPEISGKTGIFSVPVVSIFFDSNEMARFAGIFSINDIKNRIERLKGFL